MTIKRRDRTPPCPVIIEAMGGRKLKRCVHSPRPTNHTAKMWVGTPMYQWSGWAKILGTWIQVYGYSPIHPYDDSVERKEPNEWSDDRY